MPEPKVEVLDRDDARIERFRLTVLHEDFACRPEEVDRLQRRSQFEREFGDGADTEEIFKFSRAKWDKSAFDSFAALVEGDEVLSAAGCKWYSPRFLRVGMHYYTLKRARRDHRSLLWRKGGFFDKVRARYPAADAYFVTIYPHNAKLAAWVTRLREGGRFAQLGRANADVVERLEAFEVLPDLVTFNDVPQLFMAHPGHGGRVPDDFLSSVLEAKA